MIDQDNSDDPKVHLTFEVRYILSCMKTKYWFQAKVVKHHGSCFVYNSQ